MDSKDTQNPLKDWRKTTLWFRVLNGPLVEVDAWLPPDIRDEARVALLAKHASQAVKMIWQLRGKTPNELIVQGQYKK